MHRRVGRVGFAWLGDGFCFRVWTLYTSLYLFAILSSIRLVISELIAVAECLMVPS